MSAGIVYTRISCAKEASEARLAPRRLIRARDIYSCWPRFSGDSALDYRSGRWIIPDHLGSLGAAVNRISASSFLKVATFIQSPTFLEILLDTFLFYDIDLSVMLALLEKRWPGYWSSFRASPSGSPPNSTPAAGSFLHMLGLSGIVNAGYFDSLAWQILFISGLVCGHKTYATGRPWLPPAAVEASCPCLPHLFRSLEHLITSRGVIGVDIPPSID